MHWFESAIEWSSKHYSCENRLRQTTCFGDKVVSHGRQTWKNGLCNSMWHPQPPPLFAEHDRAKLAVRITITGDLHSQKLTFFPLLKERLLLVCAPRLQARPHCHIRHDTTNHQAITTTPQHPFWFSEPGVQASDVPADFAFCTAIQHSHMSRLKQSSLVQILPTAIVNSWGPTRRAFDLQQSSSHFPVLSMLLRAICLRALGLLPAARHEPSILASAYIRFPKNCQLPL